MTAIVREAAAVVGEREACRAFGMSRSSFRRWSAPMCNRPARRRSGGRALSPEERAEVLSVLHEPRFADLPPRNVSTSLKPVGSEFSG